MPKNKTFVNRKVRTIDDVKINTVETEISTPFNTLIVEAGTTGKRGGNGKSGSRLYLKIVDGMSSDISVVKDGTGKGFILKARGDCEITSIIEALDFCSSQLKSQLFEKTKMPEGKTSQSFPATLKQLKLINYLCNKTGYKTISEVRTNEDAQLIINFLQNPGEIPENCKKFIVKE